MRETDFIEKNKEKWERYEESLKRSDQDPELLHQLYVHTTDDLSISRTFYPNRSVRVYLNGLAQRTFLQIYRGRRGQGHRLFTFWTDELPRVVYTHRRALLISLAVLVLSVLIGILSYRIDPEFAEVILGDQYVRMTEANIADGDPMRVYKGEDQFGMALRITLNNILVAFITFVTGAMFCVGSIVMLVRTGVMLGVFQYFFYAQGEDVATLPPTENSWLVNLLSRLLTAGGEGLEPLILLIGRLGSSSGVFRESLLTIWIHGALEISSIVIAGGAGLVMGSGLLFPGTFTRLQSFVRTARAGLKIMLGTVPLFVIAGFLEGYVTRQTELPEALRLIFILLCFVFIVWYYMIYPAAVARRAPISEPSSRRVSSTSAVINYQRVRTLGEQLGTTLGILRSRLGALLGGTLVIALAYCVLSFYFSGGTPPAARYYFEKYFLSEFHNFHELTASFGRGRAFSFLLLVAMSLYGFFRLGLAAVFRRTDLTKPHFSIQRESRLLLMCLVIAFTLSFRGAAVALLAFLFMPYLFLLAIGLYTGQSGVVRSFRLVYTNLASSYGLFFILLLATLPLIYLIDTTLGQYFFLFVDWVIYTDDGNIDARNVALQAFCYFYLFGLLLCTWVIASAIQFGSLLEAEEAGGLKERIAQIGRKRRLQGLERE